MLACTYTPSTYQAPMKAVILLLLQVILTASKGDVRPG